MQDLHPGNDVKMVPLDRGTTGVPDPSLFPVTEPHRCSQPGCTEPAVALLQTHTRLRWFCEHHLARMRRWVAEGRVYRQERRP